MSRTKVVAFALGILLVLPLSASAITEQERTTLILQLVQKVLELQRQIVALGGASIAIPPGLVALAQGNGTEGAAPSCTLSRTLALGTRGEDVRCLQRFLIAQNLLASDSATGYFGPLTRAAVIALQRRNNLEPVGHVGKMTRALVNEVISATPASTTTSNTPITANTPAPSVAGGGGGGGGSPAPASSGGGGGSSGGGGGGSPPLPASCTLDGVSIAHDASQLFYSTTTVKYPATCTSVSQSRTCTDGTLSGSDTFNKPSCSVTGTQGPLGWWKFDEESGAVASDASGNNNPGTKGAEAVWTTGRIGGAISFNGVTSSSVAFGDNLDLVGSDLSLSIWVKPDVLTSFMGFIDKLSGGGNYRLIGYANGVVQYGVRNATNGYSYLSSAPDILHPGVWTHIATVHTHADNRATLYINGFAVATTTLTLVRSDGLVPLQSGYATNNRQYYKGAVDDMRIYDRALSANEVRALYTDVSPLAQARDAYIAMAWPTLKKSWITKINRATNAADDSLIYNVQLATHPLLDYAIDTSNIAILHDIDEIYALFLDPRFLSQKSEYTYWNGYNYSTTPTTYAYKTVPTRKYYAWFDSNKLERVLDSSQFMYAVTRLAVILQGDAARSSKYAPVIKDFYTRIVLGFEDGSDYGVFERRGWSCKVDHLSPVENFNHATFISHLLNKKYTGPYSYCDLVTDTDMFIMAGTLEMLALDQAKPTLLGLTASERDRLRQYVTTSAKLMQARFTPKTVQFLGSDYPSLVFDAGAWADHPDYKYAGYEGDAFPNASTTPPAVPAGISWDMSHGRRFVQVMETFYRNRGLTGGFPTLTDMQKIGNQLGFGTFRGTLARPKFTNFIDGSNGWHRVGYSNRVGFGYHPYAQSESFAAGAYCRFAQYSPGIQQICDGIYTLTVTSDPELVAYRKDTFEYNGTSDYKKAFSASFDVKKISASLLSFYASLR